MLFELAFNFFDIINMSVLEEPYFIANTLGLCCLNITDYYCMMLYNLNNNELI